MTKREALRRLVEIARAIQTDRNVALARLGHTIEGLLRVLDEEVEEREQ